MLKRIAEQIENLGGRAFLVGGSVRDKLLGIEPKDFDVEVFGLDVDALIAILSRFGKVDCVGRSFGVIKLTTKENDFDFSLPRRENKEGRGHKGFIVESDPSMSLRDACARRDFTINSMMIEISTGKLFDFFAGQSDLRFGILKATSEHFSEDPLRVLRGFQFAGRFGMHAVETETRIMCDSLRAEFDTLSIERVWGEWEKWARKSVSPSHGLRFLSDVEWLSLFPELAAIDGLIQDPVWHPETTCEIHTNQAVDVAIEISNRENLSGEDRMVLVFAALCHDFGKVTTTRICEDGHIRSKAHDKAGIELAERFMMRIGAPQWLIEQVKVLVGEHMFHVHNRAPSARAIRRLSVRIQPSSIKMLCWLMECDHSARSPLPKEMPVICERMLELAEQERCQEEEVQPLIMGRDLIALGMSPGRHFGVILSALFKAQVAGVFIDKQRATEWARWLSKEK